MRPNCCFASLIQPDFMFMLADFCLGRGWFAFILLTSIEWCIVPLMLFPVGTSTAVVVASASKLKGWLFVRPGETAVSERNTRPIWILSRWTNAGDDSEVWNQASCKYLTVSHILNWKLIKADESGAWSQILEPVTSSFPVTMVSN